MAFLDHTLTEATDRGWLARLLSAWRLRREQRLARLAFNRLAAYDDHILDDIGLERREVLWGSSLPIEMDAAMHVQAVARRRRARRLRRL